MPKTIILAIFTLLLAVAALVTDLIRPNSGGADSATTATSPAQLRVPIPVRTPVRPVPAQERMQA